MPRRTPIASIEVLFALAAALRRSCGSADLRAAPPPTRSTGTANGREGYDAWRLAQGMIPIDPRDYMWPVAPAAAAGRLSG